MRLTNGGVRFVSLSVMLFCVTLYPFTAAAKNPLKELEEILQGKRFFDPSIKPNPADNMNAEERVQFLNFGKDKARYGGGSGETANFPFNRDNRSLGTWTVTYTAVDRSIINWKTFERCTKFELGLALAVTQGKTYKGFLPLDEKENNSCRYDRELERLTPPANSEPKIVTPSVAPPPAMSM